MWSITLHILGNIFWLLFDDLLKNNFSLITSILKCNIIYSNSFKYLIFLIW